MENSINSTATPRREEVARAIVQAATPADFDRARDLYDAYVAANPADTEIADLGELLDTLSAVVAGTDTVSGLGGDAED